MAVVRWANLVSGALLAVALLGFLIFLPGNVADYAKEPEDVWLGGFWIVLVGLLVALCFANAKRSNALPRWRILANVTAVITLAGLLFLGRDDPSVPPLIALCVFGPIAALIGMRRRPQDERS